MNLTHVFNLCEHNKDIKMQKKPQKTGTLLEARDSDWIFISNTNYSQQFTKTSWSGPPVTSPLLLSHLHSHPEPSP